jgi:hypothetical protein
MKLKKNGLIYELGMTFFGIDEKSTYGEAIVKISNRLKLIIGFATLYLVCKFSGVFIIATSQMLTQIHLYFSDSLKSGEIFIPMINLKINIMFFIFSLASYIIVLTILFKSIIKIPQLINVLVNKFVDVGLKNPKHFVNEKIYTHNPAKNVLKIIDNINEK